MATTLPTDFPGLAALQEAGEATPAKIRKHIADKTLTKIPKIGPATAEEITAAFKKFEADNKGADDDEATAKASTTAGATEMAKTGAQKNEELANHDLAAMTPAERAQAGVIETIGEKIAHSGAVFIHDPAGPYASREAVRIPPERGRIKVEPIGFVPPQTGMLVKDGDDAYNIPEGFNLDARGDDWMKVRSPNTGQPFIR